ncbi:MAG: glycosyltransferase [Bacteroidaceae bacterium]|nr:glycosyltransferase [Bacteroidaceae bacterium]
MKRIKRFIWDVLLYLSGLLSPQLVATLRFRMITGRFMDWKHPRDINEKIQWLKFYGDTSQWPRLADKYAVREYVKEKGLADILVPFIGKWDKAEDIDWEALPNQFVMKTNHGSADALICKDKAALDTACYTQFFARQLKSKLGPETGEPHYDKIKPCIVAEELLDATKQDYPSTSPIDYKIWCFDGKPSYFFVCLNRTKEACEVATYDTDWNFYPQYIKRADHYIPCTNPLPRPRNLEQMLSIAHRLSEGFPCVRVDLYEIGGKVFFGEMTFTPASGNNSFYPQEFLDILGDLCNIEGHA